MAQLPEFKGAGLNVYRMVAAGLATIYLLPRFTRAVPSPLPVFLWPQIPWNLETLRIILPYSLGVAAVGLLESLMTAPSLLWARSAGIWRTSFVPASAQCWWPNAPSNPSSVS